MSCRRQFLTAVLVAKVETLNYYLLCENDPQVSQRDKGGKFLRQCGAAYGGGGGGVGGGNECLVLSTELIIKSKSATVKRYSLGDVSSVSTSSEPFHSQPSHTRKPKPT